MEYHTPKQLAKLLRVSRRRIYDWIERGELRALNVSDNKRPSYRIPDEALTAFQRKRTVAPSTGPTPERKRGHRPKNDGIIQFY